jgi:hypothetical protein
MTHHRVTIYAGIWSGCLTLLRPSNLQTGQHWCETGPPVRCCYYADGSPWCWGLTPRPTPTRTPTP